MKNIALSLLSTAISLLLAEILSILIMPTPFMKPFNNGDKNAHLWHRPSEIPGLDYELKPNKEARIHPPHAPETTITIRTNSFGMRSNELIKPEDASICTIAVLGDSFTFGTHIDQNRIYTSVLEEIYQQKYDDLKVQVLNFSARGYSTRDEALVLEHKALSWEPDLIVIGYFLNDPEIRYPYNLSNYFRKPEWWQYSNILRLIAQMKFTGDIWKYGDGNWFRYLHAKEGNRWGSVVIAFEDIGELTSNINILVFVVIFPKVNMAGWKRYPFGGIHTQVTREAYRNGFSVLDLHEAYSLYQPIDLMINPPDHHLSRLGHRIAAVEIFRIIEDDGLLTCPKFIDE